MKAALYVNGRIVFGDSHIEAFWKLTEEERNGHLVSGWYDSSRSEFVGDLPENHFYNKTFYLVRHGQSDSAAFDSKLTDTGREQIEEIATKLQFERLEKFVGLCSPMLRCLETAAILQKHLDIQFQIHADLREISRQDGEFMNKKEQFPQFQWPAQDTLNIHTETMSEFQERVKTTLLGLPKNCIVVTHYGFIYTITQMALCEKRAARIEIDTDEFSTGSVTKIQRDQVTTIARIAQHEDFLSNRSETRCA